MNNKKTRNVTRGYGLFEEYLSRQRIKIANRLIPAEYNKGSILDIGCGSYPAFLCNTAIDNKYGLDKIYEREAYEQIKDNKINFICHDIEKEYTIPLKHNLFDVVIMLATIEHFELQNAVKIFREVNRVLKDGGLYVMTTPAAWTDKLLRLMSRLSLVSPIEINEHKSAYNHKMIISFLEEAGFLKENITCGYFEIFMNLWVTAKK